MEIPNQNNATPLWYYLNDEQQVCGPLHLGAIKTLVEDGTLPSELQVCLAGQERWQSFATALLPPLPVSHWSLPPLPVKQAFSGTRVQEYRRTCQTCGKVWHSLLEREKKIQKDISDNNCAPVIHCCNPEVQSQSRRNVAAQDSEISRLRTCPECQSANYREEILTHDAPPTK